MKTYRVNEDWEELKALLIGELKRLGAKEGEIKQVLYTTLEITSVVDIPVADYARKELEMLREYF